MSDPATFVALPETSRKAAAVRGPLGLLICDSTEVAKLLASILNAAVGPTYLFLNCHCTAPLAIRTDAINHGLLAGWKCDSCGQTLMLSDIARASEAMHADPCLPGIGRGLEWFKKHGCTGWVEAYARAGSADLNSSDRRNDGVR